VEVWIQETEVKFNISNLRAIENGLHSMGAQLFQPRTREINLRFDTPNRDLERGRRVLRLRQDQSVRLTYKDGNNIVDGALSRREIEFGVSDMDAATHFLEALGYRLVFLYEKYRTTYELEGGHVMLDEMPFGNFLEIEGALGLLKHIAARLQLQWGKAVPASYHELFERIQKTRGFAFRDLSFENFQGTTVLPADLDVQPADA
jgi:adenylate cyclase, class 2